MDFYKEIAGIFEYLHSIRKLEKFISIDIKFPNKWSIPKALVETSKVVENDPPNPEIRFFSFVSDFNEKALSGTLSTVKQIIKVNKEREEKERLFKNTITELKTLFENNDLEDLKQLKMGLTKKQEVNKEQYDGIDELDSDGN